MGQGESNIGRCLFSELSLDGRQPCNCMGNKSTICCVLSRKPAQGRERGGLFCRWYPSLSSRQGLGGYCGQHGQSSCLSTLNLQAASMHAEHATLTVPIHYCLHQMKGWTRICQLWAALWMVIQPQPEAPWLSPSPLCSPSQLWGRRPNARTWSHSSNSADLLLPELNRGRGVIIDVLQMDQSQCLIYSSWVNLEHGHWEHNLWP